MADLIYLLNKISNLNIAMLFTRFFKEDSNMYRKAASLFKLT